MATQAPEPTCDSIIIPAEEQRLSGYHTSLLIRQSQGQDSQYRDMLYVLFLAISRLTVQSDFCNDAEPFLT